VAGVVTALDARVVIQRSASFRLDLAIAIAPGQTVALLGPNGAGKSTTVAAIAGLLPIHEGRIELGGCVLDDPERNRFVPADARGIGVVFQDYLLFPHLTVLENVAFGLRSRRVRRDDAWSRAREWIDRVGLSDFEERRPAALSGGQAQRVALARALATEPDLLLLDEPLAALDVTTRNELRTTLAGHLSAFAGPRLLITHDPMEAFLLADEIHIIEGGTVTQTGSADEIRLRPRTRYAADLAGSNLVSGTAAGGRVDTGTHTLHIADREISGAVLLNIHPTAISIHLDEPAGSPRNAWSTAVERIERLGDRVRLRVGSPQPLTAEITSEATAALHLEPGAAVWVAVKATEIVVLPGSAK
jgi:molybdate transport system ATP-binding protein